jgi:hypothetical protein
MLVMDATCCLASEKLEAIDPVDAIQVAEALSQRRLWLDVEEGAWHDPITPVWERDFWSR